MKHHGEFMKKTISFLMSLFVLLGCNPIFANVSADIGDDEKNAAELCVNMGFCDAELKNFPYGEYVTRADFALICSRIMNGETILGKEASYSDVYTDNEAFSAIEFMTELGYVSGVGDGRFDPDGKIETDHAAAILVKMLGYKADAEISGGYPIGYVGVAKKIKLMRGVEMSDEYLTYGNMAKMVYNACNTAIKRETTFGSSVGYAVSDDITLLSFYHEIKTVSGIVRDIEYQTDDRSGEIVIDDMSYVYNGNSRLAGECVRLFYREGSDTKGKIVVLAQLDTNCMRKVFRCEDAEFADNQYTYFDEKDRKQTYSIAADTLIFYNGKRVTGDQYALYGDALMTPNDGEVMAVEKNGKCVSVIIRAYKNTFVKRINTESKMIYDKFDSKNNISYEQLAYSMADRFGEAADMSEVFESTVLSVGMSLDGTSAEIVYGFETVYGTVDEIKNSADKIEVKINGELYEVESRIKSRFLSAVTLKTSGAFNLDVFGRIAGFSAYENTFKFGALISFGVPKKTFEEGLKTRILTEEGTVAYYDTVASPVIDGEKMSQPEAKAVLDRIVSENNMAIRYKTNKDGKISEIDTAYTDSPGENESVDTMYNYTNDSSAVYISGTGKFGKSVIADSGTIIMSFSSKGSSAEDNEFGIVDLSYFVNGQSYKIHAYKNNVDSFTANVLLVETDDSAELQASSEYIMVCGTENTKNENLDNQMIINGLSDGKEVSYVITADALAEAESVLGRKPEGGDILRVGINVNGKIGGVVVIWNKDSGYALAANPSSVNVRASVRNVAGYIHSFDGNYVRIVTDSAKLANAKESDFEIYPVPSVTYVFGKGRKNDEFVLGNESDIKAYKDNGIEYSRVFIHTYYGGVEELVIFND